MQKDMHFYGTYALARVAGLKKEVATTIATAAQYVDDSTTKQAERHPSGAYLTTEATAHHPADLPANLDEEDQRQVWVPFHFLPGGKGRTLEEKLVCVKDSPIARKMVAHNLSHADAPYAVELIGVTAHVYADTFAHFGFSGISSPLNRIAGDSFEFDADNHSLSKALVELRNQFFAKHGEQGGLAAWTRGLVSGGAEALSGALGHGAAATYPDQPYLEWEYTYEVEAPRCRATRMKRSNPVTFMRGCMTLNRMFASFAKARPDLAEDRSRRSFRAFRSELKELLWTPGNEDQRIERWQEAIHGGRLTRASKGERPVYDEKVWHAMWEDLLNYKDTARARKLPLYRFFQAASVHRTHVLRILLPSVGIVLM